MQADATVKLIYAATAALSRSSWIRTLHQIRSLAETEVAHG